MLIWQSCQPPFAGSVCLCWLINGGQWWEKRGRLQSIERLPLPIAHLCPGRSDPEHLSLLPSFCNCSFRPFWLYASSTRLHSHHTDHLSASLLQRLLTPIGNDLLNSVADCFKDHFSTEVYKITTRSVGFICIHIYLYLYIKC